jgi:hypothetical protein
MKISLIILTLMVNAPVFALDVQFDSNKEKEVKVRCEETQIEVPNLLGEIIQKEKGKFCFDEDYLRVFSANCQSGDCEVLKKARSHKKQIIYAGEGTPQAILCKDIGGRAQIVFFLHNDKRIKIPRCVVGQSFASNTALMENFLESRKK